MVKMPDKNIATMLILLLLVIFTLCPLGTLDNVDVTGYVGEAIELRCFDPSKVDRSNHGMLGIGDIKWMYLIQEDCSHKPSHVHVATCENGYWEYYSYGHYLVGNDSCGNGLAYIRSKEPGNFAYKCELTSDHTKEISEVTFVINVHASKHLPISSCFAKLVPPKESLMFDFICRNYHRDCFSKGKKDNEFFIQYNDTRIIPDISSINKIIVRRKIYNISSISQYYCITDKNSSPCVADNVTLTNPIGITPLVNKVTAGSDVTFVCTLNNGREGGVKHNWTLSRHIQFSRISGTASSTLKIHNVQYGDDSIVTCGLDVNGTIFYSKASLKILPENSASTVSTAFATFFTDPMTTAWSSQPVLNPESNLEQALIIACSLLLISALFVTVIIVVNSTMQRRRQKSTNISLDVQTATGLTPLDESNLMSLRYSTELSPTPRKPSVVSLPLPLTPPPTSNSVISPVEMHAGLDESSKQRVALTEDVRLLSGLCHSPPLSPVLTSTPYSSQIGHVPGRETLPQFATKQAVSLSSKELPRLTRTSRTRKTSVTGQPLPLIPKSPLLNDEEEEQRKGNKNTSPTSEELPVAVIKPTINEYSSIGNNQQGYGDSRANAVRFNSPSAVLETYNDHHGNTTFDDKQEHLQKVFPDSEAEGSDRRNNHSVQDSNIYAIPDEDTKSNIAGTSAKSIYHTIDEDSDTLLSSKGRYDDPTPAIGGSICSNHHIYELPEDEVATEKNKHSASVETPFYFTLESGKNNESEDVATGQSTLHVTTYVPEKNPNSPISMISESDQYVQIAKGRKKKQTSNIASNRVGDGKGKNPNRRLGRYNNMPMENRQ